MDREPNIAENWERAYDAFQQINFKAWDYDTVKQSLVDYLKLYYPEDFNDFIESSDTIMILELFAYIAELLAYRIDLNSHENFITTAERKESVLRLAKFISYNPSRALPARGLVKMTSIRTTENIVDSRGINLTNRTIRWNDPNNPNWKEQFFLIMNSVLTQPIGTVLPSNRVQVQDVLFELYTFKNDAIDRNVVPYSINVSDQSFPMELVSSTLTEFGPAEKRPEKNQFMSVLYMRDGLGDSSDNTGFFFLTKQGILNSKKLTFDGVLPNQTATIGSSNINQTDIWLNNIDPETGLTLSGDELIGERRKGEWEQVDIANTQNVLFNTAPDRKKYEVETLDNNDVRLIFGDGNFSEIPRGQFEVWYRVSDTSAIGDQPLVIPKSAIQNVSGTLPFRNATGKKETLNFTFSLFNPIQNSATSESLERIKSVAPSVYYTQDRMVNGRDYNEFMLKDNTILKLRAINRTFAGDSKYIAWHDPKEYYENVKIFGDDLVVYFKSKDNSVTILPGQLPPEDGGLNAALINSLIFNHIEPVLQLNEFRDTMILKSVAPSQLRSEFTSAEYDSVFNMMNSLLVSTPNTMYFTLNAQDMNNGDDAWTVQLTTEPSEWEISLESRTDNSWIVRYKTQQLVMSSEETRFFVNEDSRRTITYDTLNSNFDEIVILKANVGSDGAPLTQNYRFVALENARISNGISTGLCNYGSVITLPLDRALQGTSVKVDLSYLIPENSYVYFTRDSVLEEWRFVPYSPEVEAEWQADEDDLWKREKGVENINFLWMHRTPRYHLIDPASSNIIDAFVITRGYYSDLRLWLQGRLANRPRPPSAFQLRTDYGYLIENKMISDTLIIHPGDVKVILGSKANPELQGFLKVIRKQSASMSDNSIKSEIVSIVNSYFDINRWEFGQTFYFTDLASRIHRTLNSEIESVVLVPKSDNNSFGDLFEVIVSESEILQGSITVDDIEIVSTLDPKTLNRRL